MKVLLRPLCFCICLLLPCSFLSAQAASVNELINTAATIDNNTVTLTGEAIGEVMNRGAYSWVNVNDGTAAIGVWMSAQDAAQILFCGDFSHEGDLVEVSGIFNRACGEHGGDMDIHASNLKILQHGRKKPAGFDGTKKDWAVKLLGALVVIWILTQLKLR
ncbi:MAG: DNA-binding protein [Candidatus Omnitrophica bacterium]|jgi:hypothetical protein|nr:DNA-binding protein [Candidatus Omnitrophota bacterium]